jgi:hypothetical protein
VVPWHAGHAWEGAHEVDSDAAGRGPDSVSETDARWGMTMGSHLVATMSSGRERGLRFALGDVVGLRWAEARSTGEPQRRVEGAATEFSSWAAKPKQARRGEG